MKLTFSNLNQMMAFEALRSQERAKSLGLLDDPEPDIDYDAPHPSGLPVRRGEPRTPVSLDFENVRIRALACATAAIFLEMDERKLLEAGWTPDKKGPLYKNESFPHHAILTAYSGSTWVVQHVQEKPAPSELESASRSVFGDVPPVEVVTMAARFRLPLQCSTVPDLGNRRGAMVPHTGTRRIEISGIPCTTRLSFTNTPQSGFRLFAEAFIGSSKKNGTNQERSLLYAVDAARAAMSGRHRSDSFVRDVIDELIAEAFDACSSFDVMPLADDGARHVHVATLHVVDDLIMPEVHMSLPRITPRPMALPLPRGSR